MATLNSELFNKKIEIERIIGQANGREEGPVMIFIGGIHGNEPSGVFALHEVANELSGSLSAGKFYAVAGNLAALENGQRFKDTDLNRLWTAQNIKNAENGDFGNLKTEEMREFKELYNTISQIINDNKGRLIYLIDLHTTSSKTVPFININNSREDLEFSLGFPVPVIRGIGKFIEGPLFSFVNKAGHVAAAFEAGMHEDPATPDINKAFIYLSLKNAGCIKEEEFPVLKDSETILKNKSEGYSEVFEVCYRHAVENINQFNMLPGFSNFQYIEEGEPLAENNGKRIFAPESGHIFMPLYQKQGNDGFFIVREAGSYADQAPKLSVESL